MNMMHCAATGSISSVSGTAYDLHNNVQIGLVTDTSTDNGGRFDVTYSLRGPTGSRRAARFALFVFSFLSSNKKCVLWPFFQTNLNQRWTNYSPWATYSPAGLQGLFMWPAFSQMIMCNSISSLVIKCLSNCLVTLMKQVTYSVLSAILSVYQTVKGYECLCPF